MASADACYVGPVSTSLLGSGSRGPVLLGTLGGTLVAVKLIFADPEASALDGVSASTTVYPIPPLRVVEEPAAAHATRVLARGSSAECEVEVRALAEGGELLDLVAEDGALPPEDAARYTMQAAIAVAHSHAAGLASGQLRLEHVLRDARGDVLLIGLRHRLDPSAEPGEEQSGTRRAAGGLLSRAKSSLRRMCGGSDCFWRRCCVGSPLPPATTPASPSPPPSPRRGWPTRRQRRQRQWGRQRQRGQREGGQGRRATAALPGAPRPPVSRRASSGSPWRCSDPTRRSGRRPPQSRETWPRC
mmetsp:Transcript_15015/g.50581  ORF Transcript_15015/g.50581 Transcript_15015/m.50581 type:complete len:302 (-) Transcript_15015:1237-2142(-)